LDLELLKTLRDCIAITGRLLDLLEQDQEDLPGCISGELLAECQRGTANARRVTREIREGLFELIPSE